MFLLILGGKTSAVAQDTTWIPEGFPGALDGIINGDTVAGGGRRDPQRVYALHAGQRYIQNGIINFRGGSTLTIVGERGGTKPVIGMRPGDSTAYRTNLIEGSLHLENVYWVGKMSEVTPESRVFTCYSVDSMPRTAVVNECVLELADGAWIYGWGWNHLGTVRITNCYFRDLLTNNDSWGSYILDTGGNVDTLWVENTTITGGGLLFLLNESLCTFGYFNHNTIVNTDQSWQPFGFFLNAYWVNNIFLNEDWTGVDSLNYRVTFSPEIRYPGIINVDTVRSPTGGAPGLRNGGGTPKSGRLDFSRLKVLVADNLYWSDTLLSAYYTNRNQAWNSVGPYPVSFLTTYGAGSGPWPVTYIPCPWMNAKTAAAFRNYPLNLIAKDNLNEIIRTVTPSIKDAGVATLMAQWNQHSYLDPKYPVTPDLVHSAYSFGDLDPATIPGYEPDGVTKTEDGAGIGRFTDFIENFAFQPGHEILSRIDGLPVGSLIWNDAAYASYNSEREFSLVMAAYADATSAPVQNVPAILRMSQNYPNPFNPATTIRYSIPGQGRVSLKVFNVLGQEVLTLVDGVQPAGEHSAEWNGAALSSGVYFYRLEAGGLVITRKALVLK